MLEILACLVCCMGSEFKMLKGFAGISELAKFEDCNSISRVSSLEMYNLCIDKPVDTIIDNYVSMEEIATISQRPKCDVNLDNLEGKKFIFSGIEMEISSRFIFSKNDIVGGSLSLVDSKTGECYIMFPIEKWPYFRMKKLLTTTNVEFLLVQSGKTLYLIMFVRGCG